MSANRKYTVFISSTYEDLVDERQEIVRACLEMGHIPIGMEMFSAASEAQWDVIRRTIDSSDYYVLILARRYGSTIDTEGGISYTEKEYDYAKSKGVPVLGFVLDNAAPWPGTKQEADPVKAGRLQQFKDKARSLMASHWKSKDDLPGKFAIAISKAFEQYPRPGWVPSTQVATAEVSNELARLSQENERLRAKLDAVDVEQKEVSRQDRLIERLGGLRARTSGGVTTLLEVFKKIGGYLYYDGDLESAADASEITQLEPLIEDVKALAAFGVLMADSTSRRGGSVLVKYHLTVLGRELLHRWRRERVLHEAQQGVLEPKRPEGE